MIFDWNKNAKKILTEGKYSGGDRFERKSEYLQQLQLCTFLLSINKKKDEIFRTWRRIPNHFTEEVAADEYDIIAHFNLLYKKAENNLNTYVTKQARIKPLYIYQEEIDAINQLPADIIFRKYLLMLLGITRFYNNYDGHCYLDHKLRGYAFESVAEGREYHDFTKTLTKKNIDCGTIIKSFTTKRKAISIIDLGVEGKTIGIQYNTPDELVEHMDIIKSRTKICVNCGKEFEVGSMSQTDLCPKCYRKELTRKELDRRHRKETE